MDETGKENVGFSLLTTENPLTVNNDDAEDAEAEEEQRRRQQELQSMMAYAFDDIGDEENSTMNSSFENSHFSSGHNLTSGLTGHRNEESSIHNLEDQYRDAELNSGEQMKVLYQIQDREIKRLNAEFEKYREEREKELTQLKRKLLLQENEHNGTAISLKQCQDLLVEKKRDIDEKFQEIQALSDQINTLTISKRTIEEESKMWRSKFSELEQKMNLIDQGLYVPVSERQIRNKYEQEISELQRALEQSQKALEKAIKAKSIAENETKEIKQTHEIYAMEKEEEIHNLYSQLESSKYQCHNLTDRIESLEKEYQNLTTLLNNTTKEADSFQVSSSMKTLQAELKRSLEDQRLKRDEISRLESLLHQKDSHEAQLKARLAEVEEKLSKLEKEASSEVALLKTEKQHLQVDLETERSKLAQLKDAFQALKAQNEGLKELQSQNEALKSALEEREARAFKEEAIQTSQMERGSEVFKNELEMLRLQNEQLNKQLEESNALKKEIELRGLKKIKELQAEMQPKANEKQFQILSEENKVLNAQLDELKRDLEAQKTEEALYREQREKYEKLCLELEQTCAEQKSQLYECHSKITELEGKLLLKEKRDDLLEDLQQKALMFEEYIKHKTEPPVQTPGESILKATQEKLAEVSSENAKLKEKLVFDRAALNELTNVWNGEITRLNKLVHELKTEISSKNSLMEKHQKTVQEEMSQMSILISKLTEALHNKDKTIKEFQEKTQHQQEVTKGIKSSYRQKETLLLNQFEKNMEDMKERFMSEEQKTKNELESLQKMSVHGLEQLNEKISKQMKYSDEKFEVETKIIEAYYDLLIQQAKMRKK